MTGPERIAHNETLPASPDPRAGDPLDATDRDALEEEWVARWRANVAHPQMVVVPAPVRPSVSGRLLGLVIVALSAALVGLLLGFGAGRLSAAPRSAPASSGPLTLIRAPHGAPSLLPSSTIGTRPALVEASPDLRTPPATSDIGTAAIGGQATWYCGGGSPCTAGYGPSDLIAAIDPTLGIEQGERLTVHYRGRSVVVVVVDVCACGGSRIIDLSRLAFSQLADPSLGVIPVTIEFGGPGVTVPPTDSDR